MGRIFPRKQNGKYQDTLGDCVNIEKIRADFPILRRKIHGRLLAYLDNAATTQKPAQVLEAMDRYYRNSNANVNRGAYALAEEASALYESARKNIASFVGAKPEEIIFTSNATQSLNAVAGMVCENAARGSGILLTKMEHHSNIVPWQVYARKNKLKLSYVDLLNDGDLDEGDAVGKLECGPAVFSFTHVSNVLGTVNGAAGLCRQAKKNGVLSCLDATQSVPHMEVDVKKIGCDFCAFSGHKMLGPNGIGVLYIRKGLHDRIEPFLYGGGMILGVGLQKSTWNRAPYKFEAGTPNPAGAVGLSAAVDYLHGVGMEKIASHERKMAACCREKLSEVPGARFIGNKGGCGSGIVSFNIGKIHAHDIEQFADQEGVAIRAGHHCAMPLLKELGEIATARASFYLYNNEEEIDRLVKGVKNAERALG